MHRRIYILIGALAIGAAAANGQQLFEFTDPPGPVGVQAPATAGDGMGPEVSIPRDIVIDADVLRAAPLIVFLPSINGGFETLAQLHFEDRGNGDVVWTGAPLGSRYESSLFTVAGDAVVGNLMLGGKRYSLGSVGGRGILRESLEPSGDWCHVFEDDYTGDSDVVQVDSLSSVGSASGTDDYEPWMARIDILFAVTTVARARMESVEAGGVGVEATVQALIDWANMSFRNSDIPARLRSIGIEDVGMAMDLMDHPFYGLGWQVPELQAYRKLHGADFVHVLNYNINQHLDWGAFSGVICGFGNLYMRDDTIEDMARQAFGFTSLVCRPDRYYDSDRALDISTWQRVFAHEIGHNMGGQHSRNIPHAPESEARTEFAYGVLVNPLLSDSPYDAFERARWAEGMRYAELTEPTPDEDNTGAYTMMAYRPGRHWIGVPFFSGGDLHEWRVGDFGLKSEDPDTIWVNGEYGVHDNAETFRDTVYDHARLSEHQLSYSLPARDFLAVPRPLVGDQTTAIVDFSWTDIATDEKGYLIRGTALGDTQPDLDKFPIVASAAPNGESAILQIDNYDGAEWAFFIETVGPDNKSLTRMSDFPVLTPFVSEDIWNAPPPEAPPAPTLKHENADSNLVLAQVDGEYWHHDGGSHKIEEFTSVVQRRDTGSVDWVLASETTMATGAVAGFWSYPDGCLPPDCTHVPIPMEVGWNPKLFGNDYRVSLTVMNAGGSASSTLEFSGPPLPRPPAVSIFPSSRSGGFEVQLDASSFNQPWGGKYKIESFTYVLSAKRNGVWVKLRRSGKVPVGTTSYDHVDGYGNRCVHERDLTPPHQCTDVLVKWGDRDQSTTAYRLKFRVRNRVGASPWATLTYD